MELVSLASLGNLHVPLGQLVLVIGNTIDTDVNRAINHRHTMTIDIIDLIVRVVQYIKLRMTFGVFVFMACFLEKSSNVR